MGAGVPRILTVFYWVGLVPVFLLWVVFVDLPLKAFSLAEWLFESPEKKEKRKEAKNGKEVVLK